ncbi:MAG: aromatic ring-hydroxylating dioxygenase subunit alpha [Rhodospirillales bacterium]|nr:aromatic ring-hydroxylating dioxygenase subunit alpha [Rhodospirillales bacterium]
MRKGVTEPRIEHAALTEEAALSPTLPGYLYHDPKIMEQEKWKIFYREWQLVGHESQLRDPGDYLTAQIVDQKIFLIRGRDGKLRAFYNVCQHRAHQLLEGQGNLRSAIICPYHAWTYRVDGSLRTARGTEKMPGFDPNDFGLTPVRLEVVLGLLFVSLDPEASSVLAVYGGLFEDIRKAAPWLEGAVILPHAKQGNLDQSTMTANWKVMAENCLECYHCPPAHPALADMISVDSYRISSHGHWQKSHGDIKRFDNKAYRVPEDAAIQFVSYWHLFPNTQLGLIPGEEVMSVFTFQPRTPDQTFLKMTMLAPPGVWPSQERCNYVGEILWPEDESLCLSVHQGLRSLGYRQGRFVVHPERPGISENGVHHFQKLYARTMDLDLAP